MRFKNISRWKITDEVHGLLFFAQRLDELLWDFTLDTHKPMSLNAPFLCEEALEIVSNIEKNLIEPANLKPVLEELIWSVQRDSIAKKLLDLPIEKYIDMSDDSKLAERKTKLSALRRTLDPHRYLHSCFDELSSSVKECEKKRIDHAARTMVTTLINIGVSKQSLLARTSDFFFGSTGNSLERAEQVDDFLKLLYPFVHQCTVYFVVNDLIKTVEESLTAFRIEIVDELPAGILSLQQQTPDFVAGSGECYVSVGPLKAHDPYSAQEEGANRLDMLSDLFTVFYHQKKITWKEVALVEQCCTDSPVATKLSKGPMRKPFDLRPEKASKELNRLLRNLSIRGSSRDRFNRVADLHGICVASDVIDNQLVTLWTSLETLIPSTTGGSKIVNILDATTPFLMESYIRRLVQRFTHDLISWNRWAAKRILDKVPDVVGPSTVHRALALLSVQSNLELRKRLYAELRDFHLLRYRAFQLSETLCSPEKIRSQMALHEAKVQWQIRRIYRTRNLLVHSGMRPTYIHTLVENAHDYLDQMLFAVMKLSCGEYRAATLEEVFELAKVRYKKFQQQLAELSIVTPASAAFLCNEFDSLADFTDESWEPRKSQPGLIDGD